MNVQPSTRTARVLSAQDRKKLGVILDVLRASYDNLDCGRWPKIMEEFKSLLLKLSPRFDDVDVGSWSRTFGWTGGPRGGYGLFITEKGSVLNAHTAVASYLGMEIPEGYEIDHICENTICVKPAHFHFVPRQDNADRQTRSRVDQSTIDSIPSLFSPEQIEEIANDSRDTRTIAKSHRTSKGRRASQTQVIAIKEMRGKPYLMPGGSLSFMPRKPTNGDDGGNAPPSTK